MPLSVHVDLAEARIENLTPFGFITECWTEEPRRSRLNPVHNTAGPNI
ncbi:MAG: hypothetical protein KDG89_04245 [Geminicoccaceae bacterium]|nr:hypothetical protein [Geminicoccaceae bacterium]